MGFFDRIGQSVQNAGQYTANETHRMSDLAKNNSQLSECNRQLKDMYTQIGERYCEIHSGDSEAELSDMVNNVNGIKQQIETLNENIMELKGLKKCPNCGAVVQANTLFCTDCGQRMVSDDTVKCSNCGNLVKKGTRFCTMCGNMMTEDTPQSEKTVEQICKNCGNVLMEGSRFCMKCGTPVPQPEAVREEEPAVDDMLDYTPSQGISPFFGPTTMDTADEEKLSEDAPIQQESNQNICSACGCVIPDGNLFCVNCGSRVSNSEPVIEESSPFSDLTSQEEDLSVFEEKSSDVIPVQQESDRNICTECGCVIPAGNLFCVNCGTRVSQSEPVEEKPTENTIADFRDRDSSRGRISFISKNLSEEKAPVEDIPVQPDPDKIQCQNCGNMIPAGNRFCTRCGNPIKQLGSNGDNSTQKVCPNCGVTVSPDRRFCINCGYRVN